MATARMNDEDSHVTERRVFDESKAGVKGLIDGGATTLPLFFHQPKPRYIPPPPPRHLSIPIIDLSLPRASILSSVVSAAHNWGFFQLINHSIPLPILRHALSAARSFHELPAAERSRYYSRDGGGGSGVSYVSNVDLYRSSAASWRDTLQIMTGPAPPDPEKMPAVCFQELTAWDKEAKGLARQLMGMLAEGMGVEEDRLEKMTCLDARLLACHYYPPCPEPDVTAGIVEHSDPGVLTLLLQDEIGGLQVRKEGEDGEWWWVDVEPVSGAVVVNIGDLLQIYGFRKRKREIGKKESGRRKLGVEFTNMINGEFANEVYEESLSSKESPERPTA